MKQEEKEWKIPEELQEIKLSAFPIQCFPYSIKEYIEAVAEELQVPIDMVATGVLAVIALCNQGKYFVCGKEGWKEPINLYTLIIARPSERKTPTMAKIIKPLVEYEKEENEKRKIDIKNSQDIMELYENKLKKLKNSYGSKKEKEENIKKQIEDLNKEMENFEVVNNIRLFVDDITPEALVSVMKENNEKMGMFSDEGGIFSTLAGRYSNNIPNIETVLKAFNGTSVNVDRKGSGLERLDNPYLTILLFVQPIVLEKMFQNDEFRGKGLCARFLYCYPKSKVGTRNIDSKAIPKELEEQYNHLIKELLQQEIKEPKILTLSPEAYQCSQEFAKDIEKQLKDELEEVEDWAGKLHGAILRIAGNLHIIENIDNNNSIISEETMIHAIEIGLYYLENTKKVYHLAGADEVTIKSNRIIRILKKKKIKGTVKKYEVFRVTRGTGINTVQDIEEPLKYLIETGYMRKKDTEQKDISSKPGRPRDICLELNPKVFDGN